MTFNLDDYEPVAQRLNRFYEAHPDGRVITDLVHYTENRCVFRAEIYIGDTLVATGWEEETRGEGYINKTSHLANCETGAVGRGLANFNLAGSDWTKRASREEMSKVQRSGTYTPNDARQSTPPPSEIRLASTKQLGMIRALGRDRKLIGDSLLKYVGDEIGRPISTLDELMIAEASRVIEHWKNNPNATYEGDEEPF